MRRSSGVRLQIVARYYLSLWVFTGPYISGLF
jgi:hypothetical protein